MPSASSSRPWAIVPVKPFAEAKSRLATVLSPSQRQALVRSGLEHTLDVLNEVEEIGRTLVVSRDAAALAIARGAGADVFSEPEYGGLNEALTLARDYAAACGATSLVVIHTDLPLLTAADVHDLVANGDIAGIAIAPDRHATGTNGLFLRPIDAVAFAFGEGSFAAHLALAKTKGFDPAILATPGFAADLDNPEDLEDLLRRGWRLPQTISA